ncbi:hypothetical protein C8E05_1578 [Rhodococcus wratislaviensis]|uniref:Uncharacterized protein n=1 Tax=Rhodococcus wratislaviensis TaxID=44752 RepID=A0AB38FGY5_RHOWR|nr:hypothetical protein [Rhodococcus wratislaviensis]REE72190.1 hypothetical protein C8E05_1578 [Rhodococcus wratislaviensis]SPZ40794.1 Uncharacterised protein [Rhodococcus wratislaviensis]
MTTRYRSKNTGTSVAALVARLPERFLHLHVDTDVPGGGLSEYALDLDNWIRGELDLPAYTGGMHHDLVHEILAEIGCPPEEWFRRSMQPELYR